MTEQSGKWHETRKARMDQLFKDKKYVVVEEATLDEPQETPLGYKTKKGYWLQSGQEKVWVGKALLKQLAEEYDAVELPAPKRRGRPRKEQPLEQAEQWVSRDMPNDAQQITQAGPTFVNPNAGETA